MQSALTFSRIEQTRLWTAVHVRVLTIAVVVLSVNVTHAQSLFDRRDQRLVDPYSNIVAHQKGDLLQIVINENTDVENRDERTLDKRGSSSFDGALNYAGSGGFGTGAGDLTLGQSTDSTRAFSGDSEFRSERQFNDRFTVAVIDVQPNGNLIVAGQRFISLEGDTRLLKLSGIVREVDVLNGNMVSSRAVANLRIKLEPRGAEQAFTRQGWFSRRMNRIWPF